MWRKFGRVLALVLSGMAGGALAQLGPVGIMMGKGYAAVVTVLADQFLTKNGASEFTYNGYPPLYWQLANGTMGAGVTGAGASFKITRIDNTPQASCGGNFLDTQCNSPLAVVTYGVSGSQMQQDAITALAEDVTNRDAVGLVGTGIALSTSTGRGTGAYLEGRRDTSSGFVTGAEIRANNFGPAASYVGNAVGDSQAIWATASGSAQSSGAFIAGTAGQKFDVGFGAIAGSVATTTFRDDTSATNAMVINGTHTYGVDTTGMTMNAGGAPFLASLVTPATSSATCKQGSIEWDASFIYICTATNTWKRATLAAF